jgi:glycosyltransferase involved in cell wall biosynthesis
VRIIYYTHPAFFEPALCLVRELSRRAETHLLLELSPAAWRTAGFDAGERSLPSGLVPADAVLRDAFPPGVRDYWQSTASFHLVVHPTVRSLHPSSWSISRRVLRFAADLRPDVMHVDDVDVSPRLAIALPASRHVPLVISVHDPEPHSGERNWRKTLARRLAYPRARRFVLYNAASRLSFAAGYGIDPARVDATRLGVYDVFRQWSAAGDAPGHPSTVLFFGRLSPYKGLDTFYEAARLVAARVSGVRVVVAGRAVEGYTPPQPPTLERDGAIQVIDRYLSNADAARLFAQAAVVVCPYRDATQSGVVLTAFAFGAPVIATAVGGLPEYVLPERTGLLVPVGDPAALADAICRVLESPAWAATLRRGVAAAADAEFSWRHTVDALIRTYQAAASRP